MNDDEPTEPMLRASAYLDGELDAEEMASAEGDAAVMAEVARLRTLQDDVRSVEAPTHAARESAIAAALNEFDSLQRPATVVPIKPRPSYTRWLSVAAAIVVIGLLGVVIARASSSSNNDNNTAAIEQTAAGKLSPNDAASGDAAATESRAAATSVPTVNAYDAAAESSSALAVQAAPTPTAAASAAGGAPAEASIAEQPVAPAFDAGVPIADDAELGVIGRQLLDQLAAGTLGDVPQSVCNDQAAPRVVLADAVLIVTDTTKAVLIAGDPTTRETFALDPDTCAIIATGR